MVALMERKALRNVMLPDAKLLPYVDEEDLLEACAARGHRHVRDVQLPDKGKTTFVGTCQCGQAVYRPWRTR